MKIGVCIPWRSKPTRERHLPTVQRHIRTLLPDATHYLADSGHEPFNRSASRNLAVRNATEDGCDVVVICDADHLLFNGDLRNITKLAARGDRVHIGYATYLGLSREGTDQYYATRRWIGCDVAYLTTGAVGGFIVVATDAYERLGGYDESYIGWGHEDVDFAVRADLVRHPGICVGLWHDIDDEKTEHAAANRKRFHAQHPATGALVTS